MKEIMLHPGEMRFAERGEWLRTLLGSCLSIVMWHPRLGIGAMTHCLLPSRPDFRNIQRLDPRYVDEALPLLFTEAVRRDTDPNDYRIKLFGGSDMLGPILRSNRMPIGELNARIATLHLARVGLSIAAHDLGGTQHRSLVFESDSGKVWVRSGNDAHGDVIAEVGSS